MSDERLDFERTDSAAGKRYRNLIEHIQDATVEFEFVDGEPIIRNVNDAFVEAFGYAPAELRGESLNEWIVPDWRREEARLLDERTNSGEVNYQRVKRETADGLREFLYRGVPHRDEALPVDGVAIYTDLTDITRQKRQLQVMNRVLRHNLRNAVNVVAGNTTRLLTEFDEQTNERTETAAAIEQSARDLERLTREASDIERVIDGEPEGTVIDSVALVRHIVADYRRQHPTASLETTGADSMRVKADSRLRFAVESLVDNALEHNPAETPRVRVRVVAAGSNGWVDIHVEDDGPRIPADERRVLTGDAEITPTRHGSGLGLWLAKWTVELFGGELSFGTSELGGNGVRLRLPGG